MPLLDKLAAKAGYQRMADTAQAAEGEIAAAVSYDMRWYSNWLEAYYNPNPVQRSPQWTGYHLYEQMDADGHVYNTTSMRKIAQLSRPVVVRSARPGDRLEDTKAALARWNLDSIKQIIKKKRQILSSQDFGFSVSELIFGNADVALPPQKVGSKVKYEGGFINNAFIIKDIKSKVPSAFGFDGYGNLGMVPISTKPGTIMRSAAGNSMLTPEERLHFLVLTHDPRFENPYGWPTRASFFWDWLTKKAVRIYRMIYVEKYGMPITHGTYPPGTKKEGDDGWDKFFTALKGIQKNSTLMTPDGFAAKFIENANKSGTIDVFQNVLDDANGNISEVCLGHRTAVAEGDKSNPFQNTDSKSALRQDILETDAAETDALFNDEFIPQLIDFNFAPNGLYPYVKTIVEPEADLDKEIFRLQAAYNMHIPLSVNQQREKFGWEEPDDEEDTLIWEPQLSEKGAVPGSQNPDNNSNAFKEQALTKYFDSIVEKMMKK